MPSRESRTPDGTPRRRLVLTRSLKIMAIFGLGFLLVPFVGSLIGPADVEVPGEKADVEIIDLTPLPEGQVLQSLFSGVPIWVYRRTEKEILVLRGMHDELADPDSNRSTQPPGAVNSLRSLRPELFVFIPLESRRNCQVRYFPADDFRGDAAHALGGFEEACFSARFDLAGRRFRGTGRTDQTNLPVPEHRFVDPNTIALTIPAAALPPL